MLKKLLVGTVSWGECLAWEETTTRHLFRHRLGRDGAEGLPHHTHVHNSRLGNQLRGSAVELECKRVCVSA